MKFKLTSDEIRFLRQFRRMGQKEVAAKMDISTERYCQLENHGNLQPPALERILKALNFTFESAKKFLDALPPPTNLAP
jgi:transcriptional regulator with XRE-family HTH domain